MMKSLAGAKANVAIISFLLLATLTPLSIPEQDDVQCLQGTKKALADPGGRLSSWNFAAVATTNASAICDFDGVTCWGGNSSRVISLQLENLELSGPIPESLQFCRSLQALSLAGNNISGTIPPRICGWLPYLVRLDLSGNGLEGSLPSELANCTFLNNLELSDNKLSGTIPPELAKLQRLKTFSIAGNDLNGEIPPSFAGFNAAGFSGNRGLCGTPLGRCGGGQKKMAVIVGAGVSGAVASLAVSFGLLWWCERRSIRLTRGSTGDGRGTKGVAQR
ncbi:probable inactive receptor kinase At1g27190 [Syzygium oleosum]|uniref:probable inactive receptor kinase At1g27190 n=1 Tax=Syzygium oleosum TaxID=219896 RepID=UPI0024BBE471|nr:probable inactive receptor kinase At1g27190 [Syzygium oleosum]